MKAIVLESFTGSDYEDSPSSYEFPSRYLRFFEPLLHGEPMVAVIYEPRGNDGSGRMAYVGWVNLRSGPERSSRSSARGQPLWTVHYEDRYRDFSRPVPRTLNGEPIEEWIRAYAPGRPRNVATFGRAVRELSDADLATIFTFGFAFDLDTEAGYPVATDDAGSALQVQERATRLVATAQREARFRDDVLATYGRRCAVTGFTMGTQSPSRMFGLLDAAHIKPVWANGPDSVTNGLALTPTLHRMFDRGLFTIAYEGGRPVLVTSPHLEPSMIRSPDGSSALVLRPGRQLILPGNRASWPHPDALAYHRSDVFLRE